MANPTVQISYNPIPETATTGALFVRMSINDMTCRLWLIEVVPMDNGTDEYEWHAAWSEDEARVGQIIEAMGGVDGLITLGEKLYLPLVQ